MKKSVYSLVLQDDVVAEVDRVAYRLGKNRSQLINQILAEYVSYVTPEQRMQEIFSRIGGLLSGAGALCPATEQSDRMLGFRSPLVYKYNPTVRYTIELYSDQSQGLGELRASMRTQNATLLEILSEFFFTWQRVEAELVGETACHIELGRFSRILNPRWNHRGIGGMVSSNTIGDMIAAYVRVLDDSLKAYFALAEAPAKAAAQIFQRYRAYLAECSEIL